jgi:hypothetical protein
MKKATLTIATVLISGTAIALAILFTSCNKQKDVAIIYNGTVEELKYKLEFSDKPILDHLGADSLITTPDGFVYYVYPAPDTIFFNSKNK